MNPPHSALYCAALHTPYSTPNRVSGLPVRRPKGARAAKYRRRLVVGDWRVVGVVGVIVAAAQAAEACARGVVGAQAGELVGLAGALGAGFRRRSCTDTRERARG